MAKLRMVGIPQGDEVVVPKDAVWAAVRVVGNQGQILSGLGSLDGVEFTVVGETGFMVSSPEGFDEEWGFRSAQGALWGIVGIPVPSEAVDGSEGHTEANGGAPEAPAEKKGGKK